MGIVDTPSLISKFKTHLWPHIFEMMVAFRFNSLLDYYVATLHVETNLDVRSVECTRARDHGVSDSCKITHRGGGGGCQG